MLNAALAMLLVPWVGPPATVPGGSLLQPCTFVAKPTAVDPSPELAPHEACVRFDTEGAAQFAAARLGEMTFDPDGLAAVAVGARWYYVRSDGRAREVVTLDNGPDPLSEGRVRGRVGGKVAYFDSALSMRIPPRYDWGSPFSGGLALVCAGCREEPFDDEHTQVTGGRWGWIDASGHEVVPVTHSRSDAISLRPDVVVPRR